MTAQDVTRAQYIAQADAAEQATTYRNALIKLGYTIDKPAPIHCDNNALHSQRSTPLWDADQSI
jgi:hypothetical protein